MALKTTRSTLASLIARRLVQHLQHVPADRLALAVGVGGEDHAVGALGRLRRYRRCAWRRAVDVPRHLEIFVRLHRAVLGRQVADMAVRGQDHIVRAEVTVDGPGLGRTFDDDDVLHTDFDPGDGRGPSDEVGAAKRAEIVSGALCQRRPQRPDRRAALPKDRKLSQRRQIAGATFDPARPVPVRARVATAAAVNWHSRASSSTATGVGRAFEDRTTRSRQLGRRRFLRRRAPIVAAAAVAARRRRPTCSIGRCSTSSAPSQDRRALADQVVAAAARGSSGEPGTASTSRPCSAA